jgi:hypothetical protein
MFGVDDPMAWNHFRITMSLPMTRSLAICSSFLAMLGVLVTLLCFPDAKSWLPLGVLTYIFYFLAVWSASRLATRAVVLALTLVSLCVAFWCFWEARLSPWRTSLIPQVVVMMEYLVAGAVWLVIRRIERANPSQPKQSALTNRRSPLDSEAPDNSHNRFLFTAAPAPVAEPGF